MNVSDLMQAMANAGAPMEAVIIAVRAIEEREAVIEQRRAGERDRKRRQRANASDTDGTVTGQSRDTDGTVTDTPPLSPPPPSFPHTPNQPPPPLTPPDIIHTREARPVWPCPDGVDPKHWADWLKVRKAKKSPVTATAHAGCLRKIGEIADEEWPPGRIVQALAELGWAGVHDPRTADQGPSYVRTSQSRKPAPVSPSLALLRYADRLEEAERSDGADDLQTRVAMRAYGQL